MINCREDVENDQLDSWEKLWAPYDEATYQQVLKYLHPDDIVIEIGAGDLRLARKMAKIVKKVFAVEVNQDVLDSWKENNEPLPKQVIPILEDARYLDFPQEVTTAVLLMRHCTHYSLYHKKLKEIGCGRLVTNARWGMDVECIDLKAHPVRYSDLTIGWYACSCGSTGFREGPSEMFTAEILAQCHEVYGCPNCEGMDPDQKRTEI